ncbi:MAG: hypothetical protein ACP6IY_20550 [Promethearchaeia archaeon]
MDELEALAVLLVFNIYCLYRYPKHYILSSFWILGISWYGINYLGTLAELNVYVLIIIIFCIIINFFHIEQALKEKYKR